MLEKLNSRIQGWFAWLIISVIALTFALFGIEHYVQSRSANLAKAEVNGHAITIRDFDLYYRRNQRLHDASELSAAAEKQRKQEMVEQMILQNLTIQSAIDSGFYVSNNQAIAQIQAIPQFQEEGRFSLGRYQQALSNALFTAESFQTEVRDELLSNQERFAFSATAFALPYELEQFVKLYNQTRDYHYLVIPYQAFVQHVKIDDKAIKAYYQQHHDTFKSPEKVAIEYVSLSMPVMREKIKISDAQVKRYYDDNKSNYVTPAKWHVSHILFAFPAHATLDQQQQVEQKANQAYALLNKTPAQFEALAKTQSDDKISAMKAGVLPWIVAGQSEFDKALVDLTTVDEISAPIKTAQGYEIFKLMAYKPAQLKPFDTVKQDIKNQLVLDSVQTAYSRALEQLSDLAYQSPDTLQPLAEALQLTIQQTESFSREGGQTDLTRNKNLLQTAFSPEVVSQGNNSEPVQIDNETVVVVRLAKHMPASEQPLSEVKAEIKALLEKQQAVLDAKKLGERLLALHDQQSKAQALLSAHHLGWKDVHKATRNSDKGSDEINRLAFQIARVGAASGDTLNNGDFVLVKLTQMSEGQSRDLTPTQTARLIQNIEATHGAVDYDLYKKALFNQASIARY